MVLVSYSDSEGSEDERPREPAQKNTSTAATTATSTTRPDSNFAVDKSNPRKIRVSLPEVKAYHTANGDLDGEPAPKRPRVGGFSGFNSMLPAPKRDTQSANGSKLTSNGAPRKVFSLKTGAEPGFSRESDAELRQLFGAEGTDNDVAGPDERKTDVKEDADNGTRSTLPQAPQPLPPKQGTPMMFKPLSVARNTQKKKRPPAKTSEAAPTAITTQSHVREHESMPGKHMPAPKVNLFSIGELDRRSDTHHTREREYQPLLYQGTEGNEESDIVTPQALNPSDSDGTITRIPSGPPVQSLDSIAADLNLSASAKRQLLGKNYKDASKISSSIINFNTDQEYAANEALRASGEQVQHNPVRAIAPGKHSLKQLVNAASGQKEALEESFATGRRNKKEAGGRYGW